MRRALAIALGILAVGVLVAVVASTRDSGDTPDGYRIILDNTFGLTQGTDLRVAGVRVGSVASVGLQVRRARAVVRVTVDRPEFGDLRKDTFCTVQPQSLIGEYFIDCDPGVSPQRLAPGGTVPISQTAGTVPPDLVLNVLRLPYRQRLGVLISELGAGFAARGGDVNETIGRAIPALRQTNQVLAKLNRERATLRQLTRDAATTLRPLAANRENVARFVREANATASASASRKQALATTIRRLPVFLPRLRETLRDLGDTALAQTPALNTLRAASPRLTGILNQLGPFADGTRPFISSLARASTTGITAARTARPTVRELRRVGTKTLEPATNLRFILEHLNDRAFAVEPNPASPGGKGFTGLEALLQYPFNQAQAINLYDARGYMLKIALLVNECTQYTNAETAAANPGRTKRCSGALGPGGPVPGTSTRSDGKDKASGKRPARRSPSPSPSPQAPAGDAGATTPAAPAPSGRPSTPLKIPGLPSLSLPGGSGASGKQPNPVVPLLDYLLGGS